MQVKSAWMWATAGSIQVPSRFECQFVSRFGEVGVGGTVFFFFNEAAGTGTDFAVVTRSHPGSATYSVRLEGKSQTLSGPKLYGFSEGGL